MSEQAPEGELRDQGAGPADDDAIVDVEIADDDEGQADEGEGGES